MIVSHEYKFIFCHIGRTAGTSVENSLLQAMGCEWPMQGKGERHELILQSLYEGRESLKPELMKFNATKHATLQELKGLAGSWAFKRYFKFATIRNPYDQELSGFTKYLSRTKRGGQDS